MKFEFDDKKNTKLLAERGIGFEEIIQAIADDGLVINNDQIVNGTLSPKVSLKGVKELDIRRYDTLETLPKFHPGIKKITIINCEKLKTVPRIPDGVEELNFGSCYNLETITNLPAGVKNINFSYCKKLKTIPKIPDGVGELNLSYCYDLETITNLPAGVKKINFSYCKKLKTIPEIPDGVEELNFGSCDDLETLPNLPAGVKKINFSCCKKLKTIPKIPDGVGELNLSYCYDLETITNLPAGVKKINFSYCKKLKTIPEIPDGVEELNFGSCYDLETLPNLPAGVKKINFYYCRKLIPTPELISRLSELEESGCDVRYPDHFNLNTQSGWAKARLAGIGARYKEANNLPAENPIPSTTELMHRFLTEKIEQRGGVKEIVQAVDPVLNILDKNPQHLKWVEETAALYLDGCVNQPVAGWSEISALASIADAPTMVAKMESVKHLLVNDQIKGFVAATFRSKGVEVEAGNALLREIHKKLLQEGAIEKPWLAVPGPIAYEGSITTWLTPQRTQEFHEQIKPILEKTSLELAEFLCEGVHCKTWGEITFPQEVVKIQKSYKQNVESILSKIDEVPDEDEAKNELLEGFADLNKQSELDQHQATLKKVKQLTIDTLNLELQKKWVTKSGEKIEITKDEPSSHVAANLVLPLVTDDKSVWHKMALKTGNDFHGSTTNNRANKFKVVDAVEQYKTGEILDEEKIQKTFSDILKKVAAEKGFSKDAVLALIEQAKIRGGIFNEADLASGGYKPKSATSAVSDISYGNNGEKIISASQAKSFSKAFQLECEACGIYSGREGGKAVGLRLTFIPDDVVEKLRGEEESAFASGAKQAETNLQKIKENPILQEIASKKSAKNSHQIIA